MINRYSPIVGRAPRKMYLLRACCHLSFGFHVLSPMNLCSKALTATGKLSKHCSPYITSFFSGAGQFRAGTAVEQDVSRTLDKLCHDRVADPRGPSGDNDGLMKRVCFHIRPPLHS